MGLYQFYIGGYLVLICINGILSNYLPITAVNPATLLQIAEDTPINTTLFTVNATDPDGDRLTARLDDASKSTGLFELHVTNYPTYIVAAVKLKAQLDVDYTKLTQLTLQIVVNDGYIDSYLFVTLYITDVNDVAPQFLFLPYNVIVDENADVNSTVYTISTSDPDKGRGGVVTFSLMSVGGTPNDVFLLQDTGNNASINLVKPLDYETFNLYRYIVTATDGGGLSSTASVQIFVADIQDSPPYFTELPYLASVSEDTAVNTIVFQVHAEDQDKGVPNRIQYSIVNETCPGIFQVNNQSGMITLATVPDRDSGAILSNNGQCILNLRAEELNDHPPQLGPTTADQAVTITVIDKNDNSPEFSSNAYTLSVMENSAAGVALKVSGDVIHVSDKDQGNNGRFRLHLRYTKYFEVEPRDIQSSADVVFRVKDGSILDYEMQQTVVFTLVAEESQTFERRSSIATVTIYINDTNDNHPVFSATEYIAYVLENSPAGTSVETLSATDWDSGDYGKVTYTLMDSSNEFKIDPDSGILFVKNGVGLRLDREMRSTYYLTVVAEDGGGRRQPVRVVVNVLDENDNAPVFERSLYYTSIKENKTKLSKPLNVTAVDYDQPGTNSKITYDIASEPAGMLGVFQIDSDTGEITLSRPVLHEDFDSLSEGVAILKVMAVDAGLPRLTSTATVKITLEDGNNNQLASAPPYHKPEFTTNFPTAQATERHDISCTNRSIQIFIPITVLPQPNVTFRDPRCSLGNNGTHRVAEIRFTECGTTVNLTKDKVILLNDLIIWTPRGDGVVDFGNDGSEVIPIGCMYPRHSSISMVYAPVQKRAKFYEKMGGELDMSIDHFLDAAYTIESVHQPSTPVKIPLQSEIYLQLTLHSANGFSSQIGIFPDKCVATPSPSANDPSAYTLLEDGCPSTSKTRLIASNDPRKFRFAFWSLHFPGRGPGNGNAELVYIHCQVSICQVGQCAKSCSSSTKPSNVDKSSGARAPSKGSQNTTTAIVGQKRKRRSIDPEKSSHLLSSGPFQFTNEKKSYASSVGLAIAVMGSVFVIALVVSLKKTRKASASGVRLPQETEIDN